MKYIILLLLSVLPFLSIAQPNVNCASPEPICTSNGLSFTANTNAGQASALDPGNNYGCLGSQPNPSWYYLEIDNPGNIDMALSAPSDIDFIVWGPFPDLNTATSNCGSLSNIVDCSFSATNNETPSIPNAQNGEVYIMLITNYASVVQNITLTQTGGSGTTNCGIVSNPPCNASAGTYSYEVNGQVVSNTSISLCPDDCFDILSNQDYTLPPSFPGDSSQLMYLIYNAAPTGNDPSADPAFTNIIITGETLSDCNDGSSPIISGLGYGTYYFRPVTGDQGSIIAPNDVDYDKDGDGCFDFGPTVEITYLEPINLSAQISCNGTLNGNGVEISATGGAPDAGNGNYNFTNNGGDGSVSPNSVPSGGSTFVTGLGQGDVYNVLVTDANGCSDSITNLFVLPTYTTNITNATDCGSGGGPNNDGEITVVVDNGSGNGGPYDIVINGTATSGTSASESGLNSGSNVNFTIEDNEGCIVQGNETIGSDGISVTINPTVTNVSCGGLTDGAVSVGFTLNNPNSVPGISIADVFLDDNGTIIDPVPNNTSSPANFSNLGGGSYSIEIEVSNGCVFSQVVTISEPNAVVIDTIAVGPPSCNEMVSWDGSINVATSGGTQPRVTSWFNINDLTTPIGGNVGQLTQLPPGTYMALVVDDNGCRDSIEVDIIPPGPITIDSIVKRVSCPDSTDGAITVFDIQNTAGTLTFDWTPNGETTQSLSGLTGGDYSLTITDQNGCVGEFDFTVPAPTPITLSNTNIIDSDCFPGTNGNGQVSAQASGGWSGNFTFQWFNVADTSVNSNNPTWGNRPPGDYALIAIDDDGCVVTDTFTVAENPVIAGVEADPTSGLDPLDVVFTNTSTTDSGTVNDNFTYIWDLANGTVFNTEDVDTLVEATYNAGEHTITLIVRNANGCRDTATVTIEVIPPLKVVVPNVFTPNGDGDNDFFSFKLQGIESFSCVIFDRWGKQVYEWNDHTTGWDGRNQNGKDVPEGVYFYMYEITGLDGTSDSNHGNVHLVR